jgi:asparagine synthase (glutamine-hydrolysing)
MMQRSVYTETPVRLNAWMELHGVDIRSLMV